MKRVGSRLCGEINYAAGKASILGTKIVRLNLELLYSVLRRHYRNDVKVGAVGGNAIQENRALSRLTTANLKISKGEWVSSDRVSTGRISARR